MLLCRMPHCNQIHAHARMEPEHRHFIGASREKATTGDEKSDPVVRPLGLAHNHEPDTPVI